MRKLKSGVYCLTCKVNGKKMYGSAGEILKRWSNYRTELKNGDYNNPKLQADVDLYGIDNFEFKIEQYCKKSDLLKLERQYIHENNTLETGYNIRDIIKTKKKIRRGKEAKNYKIKRSLLTRGSNNARWNGKLLEEDIIEIKVLFEYSKLKNKEIYELFKEKTSKTMISRIKIKDRYKHITIDDLSEEQINSILKKYGIAESSPFFME